MEKKHINKPFGLSLTYYEFILTENCNLRCTYCFDDYFSDRKSCNYDTTMSLDIMDDMFNFIDQTRTKNENELVRFSFFGGEPTMNWPWIVKFIDKAKKEFNFRYSLSMNTNGIALNTERIDFLLENKVGIGLSIDGIKKSHNQNRITKKGEGSFDEVAKIMPELIVKFESARIPINLLAVVTDNTIDYLYENYKFFMSISRNINFQFECDIDKNDEYYEKFERIMRRLFVDENNEFMYLMARIKDSFLGKSSNSYCFRPQSNVSINPKGDMFFCHRLVPKMKDIDENTKKLTYGNIYEGYDNLDFFENMSERINFQSFKLKSEECQSCIANGWCSGGCVASHIQYNGSTVEGLNELNPTQCKIFRILTKITVDSLDKKKRNMIK